MNEEKKKPQLILFKRVRVDAKKGVSLKLFRREKRKNKSKEKEEFSCDQCDFKAKTKAGLGAHKFRKHE